LERRRAGREREEREAGERVVGRGADQNLLVGERERERVDARAEVERAGDDQRVARGDARGDPADQRRLDVVDPRVEQVAAAERAPGERVAARVDRDEVLLLERELGARRADVEVRVEGQVVDVDRRARVALHIVLVERAEEPRVDQRARGGGEDRDADVRDVPVDVRDVDVLRARLVHRGPGVGRRRPERLARAAVDARAGGAQAGVAGLDPLQLDRPRERESRPRDEERVRDPPLDRPLA